MIYVHPLPDEHVVPYRNGNFSGPLPTSWSSLVSLTDINLSDNPLISGGIPNSWAAIAASVYVSLNNNPLM